MRVREVLRRFDELTRCLLVPAVAAFSIACGGPRLGDLETPAVSVTMTARASEPSVAAAGEPAGGLGVLRAFVSLSSLALLPCRADAAEIVLAARGYDLLQEPPPSEYVTTAVTELCALRLDIDPLSQNGTEGVPEGAAIYVEGSDAAGAPFQLASEQSMSLLLEAEADSSFGSQPLIAAFDLSTWLMAVPLTEDMAEMAIEMLEKQTRAALALYVDADESGTLDEAEQTPVAQTAAAR